MTEFRPSLFLRRALIADAVASAATGAAMALGAGYVHHLLGLPGALLEPAGLLLIPYAALVAWLGLRDSVPRIAVWAVIVGNAAWAAASIVLLFEAGLAPTLLGMVFVVGQAAVVAAFGELQFVGLLRTATA